MNAVIELALGFGVGIVLALTGAGGGILAVPALVFGAGLDTAHAAPVALAATGMAAAAGAAMGLRAGLVRYRAALAAAGCGALFAPLGTFAARHIGNTALTLVFALVLAWVALRMLMPSARARPVSTPPCRCDTATGRLIWTPRCARALLATGSLAGLCAGMLGVGGGFVLVPALRRATDLAMASVVATSLAVIALVAGASVATSAIGGTLEWAVVLPFAAGAVVGMLGGRTLAGRADPTLQQRCFGSLALGVALALAVKAMH